jgi:hypothetical protein
VETPFTVTPCGQEHPHVTFPKSLSFSVRWWPRRRTDGPGHSCTGTVAADRGPVRRRGGYPSDRTRRTLSLLGSTAHRVGVRLASSPPTQT